MCTDSRLRLARGFTLLELIIFIVVVAVGVVGILKVYDVTVARSADPLVHKQALALAEALLEEITAKPVVDPSPGTPVGLRGSWRTVGDYHGKTNAALNNVATGTLALPANLSGYAVAISVTNDSATLPGVAASAITVTVTHGRDVIALTGYKTP